MLHWTRKRVFIEASARWNGYCAKPNEHERQVKSAAVNSISSPI